MKVKFVLLFLIFFGAIGCTGTGLNYFTGQSSQTQGQGSAGIFSKGKTYVRLENMRDTKETSGVSLDHPKYLRKDILSSVLASIFYNLNKLI